MGQKEKKAMSYTATAPRYAPVRRTGRKMHLGRLYHDPHTNRTGYFSGYCDNCEFKNILTKDEITILTSRHHKDEKSWFMRLYKHLLAIRAL